MLGSILSYQAAISFECLAVFTKGNKMKCYKTKELTQDIILPGQHKSEEARLEIF